MGHGHVDPEEVIADPVADVLLVAELMQPQLDDAVAEDHADDRQRLQQIQLDLPPGPVFRFCHPARTKIHLSFCHMPPADHLLLGID